MAASIVKKKKWVPIDWSCQESLNLPDRPSPVRWGPSYVPMICVNYLDGRCDKEKYGCRLYHIESTWRWQIKKDDGSWCKLPDHLANEIENAYYDVSVSQITLPRLPGWLKMMLGQDSCIVDFKEMKIKGNSGARTVDVRRLCTPSSVRNTKKYATEFVWYMQGATETDWEIIDAYPEVEQKYLADPGAKSHTLSLNGSRFTLDFRNMSGNKGKHVFLRRRPKKDQGDILQIENRRPEKNTDPVKQSSSFPLTKKNQLISPEATTLKNASKPKTNADSLKQSRSSTQTKKKQLSSPEATTLRNASKPDKIRDPIKQSSSCPQTNTKKHDIKFVTRITQTGHVSVLLPDFGNLDMKTNESREMLLVPLSPNDEKAVQIKKVMLSGIENINNIKIVEVQNQNLSRPFNNMLTEIVRTQEKEPLVLRLLHCPRPNQVDKICRNNFSPDLQMPGIIQNIGKGTYFFESPAEAAKCCPNDAPELVLMLADVYIGDATPGNPTLSCPPKKPASGTTFSPCVGEFMKDKRGKARNDTTNNLSTANNEAEVNNCATDLDTPEASLPQVPPLGQRKSYMLKTPGSGLGERFDTLVDSMTDPGVFVKFSKREYCPKYIITFSLLDAK